MHSSVLWCPFLVGLEDRYHRKGVVYHLYILLELTYIEVSFFLFLLTMVSTYFCIFTLYFIFWGYTSSQECISVGWIL